MGYTYIVTTESICELYKDDIKIDSVGPWDSADGANSWGAAVCAKYNSLEYAEIAYPGEPGELLRRPARK